MTEDKNGRGSHYMLDIDITVFLVDDAEHFDMFELEKHWQEKEKDELGAHDTCNLGFESQGNESMSSGEVGLHEEEENVAYFGFESQRKALGSSPKEERKRMRRTRWPQVR